MTLTPEVIGRLRRMVNSLWPRRNDKDDLLQEAMIGAWQARDGMELCAGRRQCIDYLRRVNPRSRGGIYANFVDMPILAAKDDIEGDLILREGVERLRRAANELPSNTKPYAMAALEGIPTKLAILHISASSGCGTSNGWRLHRMAMDGLRAGLINSKQKR